MGRKTRGSVMEMVTIGITILAMSIAVMAYLECSNLMLKKLEISQVSRQYILKMETEGYLTETNRQQLITELETLGMHNIDLKNTTLQPVSYGETILLEIHGTVSIKTSGEGEEVWNEGFEEKNATVSEKRMSTAKN